MKLSTFLLQERPKIRSIYRKRGIRGLANYASGILDCTLRLPICLSRPTRAQIQIISGICNLSCKICPPPPPNKGKEISFEQFKKIFDRCGPIDELRLSAYGEPFLVKDIFTIIEYAKASGCRVGTTTNMMLIDAAMAQKLIKAQFDTLDISFDGATKETFEDIRTGARFETIIDNIKTLNRIKKERGSKKPELGLSVTVMKKNANEITHIIKIAAELGILRVNINPLRTTKQASLAIEEQTLNCYPQLAQQSMTEARKKAKELGIYLRTALAYPNEGCTPIDQRKGISGCKQPWQLPSIHMDGSVRPCCRANVAIGNIFEHTLARIWNDDISQRTRRIVRKKGSHCIDCCKALNTLKILYDT